MRGSNETIEMNNPFPPLGAHTWEAKHPLQYNKDYNRPMVFIHIHVCFIISILR